MMTAIRYNVSVYKSNMDLILAGVRDQRWLRTAKTFKHVRLPLKASSLFVALVLGAQLLDWLLGKCQPIACQVTMHICISAPQ